MVDINPYGDEGGEGRFEPKVVTGSTLSALRNWAGVPPVEGKHWIMIDLETGKLKWYKSSRRRFGYRRSSRRRY